MAVMPAAAADDPSAGRLVNPLHSLGPDQASHRFLDPSSAAMPGRTTHRFDARAATAGERPYQLNAPGVHATYRRPLILSLTYRGFELDVAPSDGHSSLSLVPPDAVYHTTPAAAAPVDPRHGQGQGQPLVEPNAATLKAVPFSLDGRVSGSGEQADPSSESTPPQPGLIDARINVRIDRRLGLPDSTLNRVANQPLDVWLRGPVATQPGEPLPRSPR